MPCRSVKVVPDAATAADRVVVAAAMRLLGEVLLAPVVLL
jgi:hypothetical protein